MTRAREPDRGPAQPADAGVGLQRAGPAGPRLPTVHAEREAIDLARFWLDRIGLTAQGGLDRRLAAVRRPAQARDRARHVHPAAPAVPRRARRRPQPARDGRPVPAAARHPRGAGRVDPADRARHGHGDGHLRPHRRARLWPQDRRRHARGDPQRRRGDQGLSGRARGGGAAARGRGRSRRRGDRL